MRAFRVAATMAALWWALTVSFVGAVRLTHAAVEGTPRGSDGAAGF